MYAFTTHLYRRDVLLYKTQRRMFMVPSYQHTSCKSDEQSLHSLVFITLHNITLEWPKYIHPFF